MLINKLKQIFSGQFIQNVGWMGGAEFANRIFRLATTVTLARTFTPEDYGLTAIVYTVAEFANVLTLRKGIGAKIVQAEEQDLKVLCDTSYWLNWILCAFIFIIQCFAALFIAKFYGDPRITLPICVTGLMYLMMPFYLINSAIIQRENKLKITAFCSGTQSLIANILTVTFALLGMGFWSVVWPMVLTTPVWIFINWKYHPWRPPKSFTIDRWQEITRFGGHLLGVELLGKLRGNLDYLIIGKFLGIDALGVYYFAFNAGLGISLNVISAFNSALFPYLCEVRTNRELLKKRFFASVKKTYTIIGPLILLQSSLATFYVPIIFGQQWVSAIPVLILICLSAMPIPLGSAVYDLFNTVGKPQITLYWTMISTTIFGILVLVAVRQGIIAVAIAVLVYQILGVSSFASWGIKYIFNPSRKFS